MNTANKSFDLLNGIDSLFDHIPQCLFFVKDPEGRFLKVNDSMARVFGASHRNNVIGYTDADFLPAYIAESYRRDDLELLKTGEPMRNRVELVTSAAGIVDWIVTTKVPIKDASGKVVGVAGFSRQYEGEVTASTMPEELQAAIAHIRKNFRGKLLLANLAGLTGRSISAFERAFKMHLHLTPTDFIRRVRIHEACQQLIRSQKPLSKISTDCGFSDQAHFSREFKRVMRTTPSRYRSSYC